MRKIVLLMLVCLALIGTVCFADSIPGGTKVSTFDGIGNVIIGAFKAIAIIVAVVLLLYVGVKFMLAAPSEKANLKGMLIPYLVGAIVIFAAVPIVTIIQNLAGNIKGS